MAKAPMLSLGAEPRQGAALGLCLLDDKPFSMPALKPSFIEAMGFRRALPREQHHLVAIQPQARESACSSTFWLSPLASGTQRPLPRAL